MRDKIPECDENGQQWSTVMATSKTHFLDAAGCLAAEAVTDDSNLTYLIYIGPLRTTSGNRATVLHSAQGRQRSSI